MNQTPALDVDYARAQFPGLSNGWVLFDNAGGTQVLFGVVERMNEFLFNRNVQIGGSYALSQQAAQSLQEGRAAMMQLVNARRPEEIVFAPSATVAVQNLVRSMESQLGDGDEVIVTVFDHESNIGPWTSLERRGVKLRYWELDRDTLEPNLDDLGKLMNDSTRLVAATWVSNVLGAINPIADIAHYVRARGAKICVDAVAYAPHRAVDVQATGVDYLVLSLYKVFGPHFALLYGRHELLAELDGLYHYFHGKEQVPTKLEPGNASYELAYGSSAIVDYLAELGSRAGAPGSTRERVEVAYQAITAHESALCERLLAYLRNRGDCRIIGRVDGRDVHRVPTVSFRVQDRDSSDIARGVDDFRIAIRCGDFHARRLIEHLGFTDRHGVVRVSMAHYNTLAEVDALVAALDEVLG